MTKAESLAAFEKVDKSGMWGLWHWSQGIVEPPYTTPRNKFMDGWDFGLHVGSYDVLRSRLNDDYTAIFAYIFNEGRLNALVLKKVLMPDVVKHIAIAQCYHITEAKES